MDELQELKDKINLLKDDCRRQIGTGKEMIADLEKENPQTSATLSAINRLKIITNSRRNILSELNKLI